MFAWFETSAIGRRWEAIGAWFRGQKLIQELSALPHDETERILHDIGLSMSDMPALTHPNCGPSILLPQRLEKVGLDPDFVEKCDPMTFHDLQLSCVRCNSWRRCARDLARGDVQSGLDTYCLNAHVIDSLVVNRDKGPAVGAL